MIMIFNHFLWMKLNMHSDYSNFIDLLVPNTFYLSLNSAICNNERSYILTYSPNTELILKQLSNLEAMLQVMNN